MTTAELSIWIVKYEEHQTDLDWLCSHNDLDEVLYEAVEMSENSVRIWKKQASFREELSEITDGFDKYLSSYMMSLASEFTILTYAYNMAEEALKYKNNTLKYHAYLTHIKYVLDFVLPIKINLNDRNI